MLNYICEWMENIAFYLVILIAIIQMVPHGSYEKYIRFFAGLILILLLSGPILKLFGMEKFQNDAYREAIEEIEKTAEEIERIMGEEGVIGE